MTRTFPVSAFLIAAGLVLAETAWAHPGHGSGGFAGGLIHPLTGADHLWTMVAVGLWAAQRGGKTFWWLPATFLSALLAGTFLAYAIPGFALFESGIAASLLLLGLVIMIPARLPTSLCLGFGAALGVLHGYAHGVELAPHSHLLSFAAGMLVATAGLHLAGMVSGVLWRRHLGLLSAVLGGATALFGSFLLLQG